MKLKFCMLVLLSVLTMAVTAQDYPDELLMDSIQSEKVEQNFKDNHFRLVYIDHEPTTPIAIIHQRLEKLHDDAIESGSLLIIYLADEDRPLISLTNFGDSALDERYYSEDAYDEVIEQMYIQTAHEVWASYDLNTLKSILGSDGIYPLFSEKDTISEMNFKSVILDFYVGSQFWNLRCNEELLAQLFVSLKIDEKLNTNAFPITKLAFNVLKPRGVQLMYPSRMPFGRKNLGGINEKIEIKEYN